MADTPAGLAERMRSEGEKTLQFFNNLNVQQWQQTIYAEGALWSVKDLLAHFVATESGMRRLLEDVLSGGAGSPDDFDLNAYNARKVASLKDATPDELLTQFSRLRAASVSLVAGMSADDLNRQGRHPWLGMAPLEDIIKLMYRHNQIHQRDIRRALEQ